MKANEKIGINLHQSHCSIVPKNTALLFPNLLHFIFPKSLYFFFLFTQGLLGAGAIAVQSWFSAENMSRYCYFVNNQLRSVAAQCQIEARKLSGFT